MIQMGAAAARVPVLTATLARIRTRRLTLSEGARARGGPEPHGAAEPADGELQRRHGERLHRRELRDGPPQVLGREAGHPVKLHPTKTTMAIVVSAQIAAGQANAGGGEAGRRRAMLASSLRWAFSMRSLCSSK